MLIGAIGDIRDRTTLFKEVPRLEVAPPADVVVIVNEKNARETIKLFSRNSPQSWTFHEYQENA